MIYAKFLGILINILFLLLGAGVIWIIVAIFSTSSKNINSGNQKEELPEIQTEELDFNSTALAKSEIEETLSHLEKEKRAIALGYNNMSPTHKEATKARIKRIEEKIEELRRVSVFLSQ
jgi:hypothetical protein